MKVKQSELDSIKKQLESKAKSLLEILPENRFQYGFEFPPAPPGWTYNRTSFGTAVGLNVVIFMTFAGKINNIPVYYDGWDRSTVFGEVEVISPVFERP